MKKIFVMVAVAAGLLFAGNTQAQVAVHLGYSPESWNFENEVLNMNVHSFFAGVDFQIPIAAGLSVSLGAQGRWSTESGEEPKLAFDTTHRTNIVAAEVPVLINYSINLTDDLKITPFAGPKFTYYFKGRTRYSNDKVKYEWFDEKSDYRTLGLNPFNVSAVVGVAVTTCMADTPRV